MQSRGLGKGLSALIPERQEKTLSEASVMLKIDKVVYNSLQPRTNYNDEKLDELKASIKEKGVLQPIIVREKGGTYEVIAGERRLRAAKALSLNEIPAVIRNVTDREALVLALIENLQREELNPIEEAEAYKKLIEGFDYTHDTVAQSIGKDRSTITNLLRLLKLPEEIQKNIYAGKISVGHARALLVIESPTERIKLANRVIQEGLSVRALEKIVSSPAEGKKENVKKRQVKDFEILALEEELQRTLGTRVNILHKNKKGKIILEYYSLDQFDRIVGLLKK